MGRPQLVGACVVLAALAVMGGAFALVGFAAAAMTGGTGLTHVIGLGGATVRVTAFTTLVGTGLSPHEREDVERAGQVLRVLVLASAALSLLLLAVLAIG